MKVGIFCDGKFSKPLKNTPLKKSSTKNPNLVHTEKNFRSRSHQHSTHTFSLWPERLSPRDEFAVCNNSCGQDMNVKIVTRFYCWLAGCCCCCFMINCPCDFQFFTLFSSQPCIVVIVTSRPGGNVCDGACFAVKRNLSFISDQRVQLIILQAICVCFN